MEAPPPFEIRTERDRVRLVGDLGMRDAGAIWRELRRAAAASHGPALDVDLGGARSIDGAVMSLLVQLRGELASRGISSHFVGAPPSIAPIVHLYGGDAATSPIVERAREALVERLGASVAAVLASTATLVRFTGELVAAVGGVIRAPGSVSWRSIPALTARAGTDGVPIVALLNFLVGFVMAYQSANQLKLYGANVFVADVVGISVTRELAPLMTAIIVSGRSGASFAAELGTMRVAEEIDALRTLGFSPVRWLVLPRVLALLVATPILTLLGDVVGVAGGAAVGALSLDVTPHGYLSELRTAVRGWDVITGLVKSAAFGAAIALIGCQQGFAARGGAAGVGRRTTSTVVLCLFTIVILDTVFTMFFRMFDV